jgi:glutamyl-tRNA(Gln) amidotransferase subunit D
MESLAGYRGQALKFLRKAKARIGDVLEVKTEYMTVSGTLVPRYLYADSGHIVLKLASGYNVGLNIDGLEGATVKSRGEKPSFSDSPPPKALKGLPRVLILGTGGTIASRIDYRTGAVHPAVTARELLSLVPELSEIAKVEPEILFNILSENITPSHWSKVASRIAKAVSAGFDGVVVTHGTDTMGYTAAALSFALQKVPIPVVLVGAQRSPDRPSSDATLNLIGGVSIAARAPFSGVYVAMHLNESDEKLAVHGGTRVRKNHTSRRDAFVSVGVPLAAVWGREGIESVASGLPARAPNRAFRARVKFDGRVALMKFYPSMPGSLIATAGRSRFRGLVLEGTGLGHVNTESIAAIRTFVKKGGLVGMTSQCMNGRVNLNVYETGRDLLAAGVLPLEDMLAETALVKTMWTLGNSKTVKDAKILMKQNLAGEMTKRTFPR